MQGMGSPPSSLKGWIQNVYLWARGHLYDNGCRGEGERQHLGTSCSPRKAGAHLPDPSTRGSNTGRNKTICPDQFNVPSKRLTKGADQPFLPSQLDDPTRGLTEGRQGPARIPHTGLKSKLTYPAGQPANEASQGSDDTLRPPADLRRCSGKTSFRTTPQRRAG